MIALVACFLKDGQKTNKITTLLTFLKTGWNQSQNIAQKELLKISVLLKLQSPNPENPRN